VKPGRDLLGGMDAITPTEDFVSYGVRAFKDAVYSMRLNHVRRAR
jgi:hypothetical protein